MSNADLATTVALSRYRWLIPVLAVLMERNGARFAEMSRGLGISADSLSNSLQHLVEMGWVMKNPGHGHPLRPEYLLTAAGRQIADLALGLFNAQRELNCDSKALKRWSLPILHILAMGTDRFNAIRRALPDATPRAISLSMKALQDEQLVERSLQDGFPPVTVYSLSDRGAQLADALTQGT